MPLYFSHNYNNGRYGRKFLGFRCKEFIGTIKVIIEKSRGEVSLVVQDTIENVSNPIRNLSVFFLISYIFDTSKSATVSFEVFDSFIGQKVLKL